MIIARSNNPNSEKKMLACVSHLEDVPSYEDVRNNKEWLTTSEVYSFIKDNCPHLFSAVDRSTWTHTYINIYNKCRTKQKVQSMNRKYDRHLKTFKKPTLGRHYIECVHVTDNGRRPVRFYNKSTIMGVETFYQQEHAWWQEIMEERNKAALERLEAMNAEKESLHGSFYDPEWF